MPAADPLARTADTLSRNVADSLSRTADTLASVGERVPWNAVSVMPEAAERAGTSAAGTMGRAVDAAAMFGERSVSELPERMGLMDVMGHPGVESFTDNPVFQLTVVALLVCYVLLLYYFRGEWLTLLGVVRKQHVSEKLFDDHSNVFATFVEFSLALGCVACGGGTVKVAALFVPPAEYAWLPQWAVWAAAPAIAVAAAGVLAVQRLLLWCSGSLTFGRGFTDRLFFFKKLYFALCSITVTPILLLVSLSDGLGEGVLFYLIVCQILVFLLVFLAKSYTFFVEQNVSILHWFLYLCCVEILPVSTLVLLAR